MDRPTTKRPRVEHASLVDAKLSIQARLDEAARDIAAALVQFGADAIRGSCGSVDPALLFLALFAAAPYDAAISHFAAFFEGASGASGAPTHVTVATALIELATGDPEKQHSVTEALRTTLPFVLNGHGDQGVFALAIRVGSLPALTVLADHMPGMSDPVARLALAALLSAQRTELAFLAPVIGARVDWTVPFPGLAAAAGLDGLDGLDGLMQIGEIRDRLLAAALTGGDIPGKQTGPRV